MAELRFYLHRLLRKLHWVFALCLLGGLIGSSTGLLLPETYQSEARLLLEGDAILQQSPGEDSPAEPLELVWQHVLHRDHVLDLAARLNVYPDEFTGLADDDIVRDMRDRITITREDGAASVTMIKVGFKAPDPQLAHDTAASIVSAILAEDRETRRLRTDRKLDFFRQDTRRLGALLEKQEAELLGFLQQNENALPETLNDRREQFTKAQERLTLIDHEIAALEAKVEPVERKTPLTPSQLELVQLERELAARSTLMSPENPKLRILNLQTDTLRQRLQNDGKLTAAVSANLPGDAYTTGRLMELRTQKTRIADEIALLAASIEQTAANGMRLEQLRRDREQTRARYGQAVINLERAETSDLIETLGHAPKLILFERATFPTDPEGFGLFKMALAGVAAGFMVAVFLIAFCETTTSTIRRPEDLTAALGIVPFATLPPLQTRADKHYKIGAIAALVGFCLFLGAAFWISAKDTTVRGLLDVSSHAPSSTKRS